MLTKSPTAIHTMLSPAQKKMYIAIPSGKKEIPCVRIILCGINLTDRRRLRNDASIYTEIYRMAQNSLDIPFDNGKAVPTTISLTL